MDLCTAGENCSRMLSNAVLVLVFSQQKQYFPLKLHHYECSGTEKKADGAILKQFMKMPCQQLWLENIQVSNKKLLRNWKNSPQDIVRFTMQLCNPVIWLNCNRIVCNVASRYSYLQLRRWQWHSPLQTLVTLLSWSTQTHGMGIRPHL